MAFPSLTPPQIVAMTCVRRWHTQPTLREQSVAEHSHQVALLALWLAPENTSDADRLLLLELALLHDAHEPASADLPGPVKAAYLDATGTDLDQVFRKQFWAGLDPYLRVPPHIRLLVEVADDLEAAIYARNYLPHISEEVADKAVRSAGQLSSRGFRRALMALGIQGVEGR